MNVNVPRYARDLASTIDGMPSVSEDGSQVEVINPSTGCSCASIPSGCAADANLAVASSRRVFEEGHWSDLPPSAKKKVLHRWADLIEARAQLLDAQDAEEMGKPVSVAAFNAVDAAGLVRFCGESVDKVLGDVYASDSHSLVTQRRVPRGVVAAVVPWNFPTFNALLKVAPALAAGNSVVVKPSEMSPSSSITLAHLALEAGLPPGVLNVVLGLGETIGRSLGLHMDVDMVTFTGSTEVGRLMLQYAGQSNMKVVHAECGGKSPQIVFGDGVDLDAASASIAGFLLTNQGQICSVGSRVLVHESIESLLTEKIIAHMRKIVMGNALEAETTFGPIASARQCERVLRYIECGRTEGAQLVTGGQQVRQESGGFFVEPTLFRGVSPDARIAQEEIFGPVLSVIPFRDEEEALRIANGTLYGLLAYVWTANLSTGMRMAKGIRSSVLINAVAPLGEGAGHAFSSEPARQSGIGVEGGLAGIEGYMRRQTVWFNHG